MRKKSINQLSFTEPLKNILKSLFYAFDCNGGIINFIRVTSIFNLLYGKNGD